VCVKPWHINLSFTSKVESSLIYLVAFHIQLQIRRRRLARLAVLDISASSTSGQLAPPSPNAGMPNSPPAPGPSQLNIEIGLLLSYINVEAGRIQCLFSVLLHMYK
jgi:hypothetical protein